MVALWENEAREKEGTNRSKWSPELEAWAAKTGVRLDVSPAAHICILDARLDTKNRDYDTKKASYLNGESYEAAKLAESERFGSMMKQQAALLEMGKAAEGFTLLEPVPAPARLEGGKAERKEPAAVARAKKPVPEPAQREGDPGESARKKPAAAPVAKNPVPAPVPRPALPQKSSGEGVRKKPAAAPVAKKPVPGPRTSADLIHDILYSQAPESARPEGISGEGERQKPAAVNPTARNRQHDRRGD